MFTFRATLFLASKPPITRQPPPACSISREGEIVVISDGGTCIGTIPSAHDLSALGGRALRTLGGIAESHARFIPSYRLNDTYAEQAARGGLRFYIFDFAINGVVI
jgi:phosphonoacetate hydrolase